MRMYILLLFIEKKRAHGKKNQSHRTNSLVMHPFLLVLFSFCSLSVCLSPLSHTHAHIHISLSHTYSHTHFLLDHLTVFTLAYQFFYLLCFPHVGIDCCYV